MQEPKEVVMLTKTQRNLITSNLVMRRTELVLAEDNPDIIKIYDDTLIQLGVK